MRKTLGYSLSISAVIFLTLVAASANRLTTPSLDPSDLRVVEQLFTAWNSHDADKVAACFSETAVYEDVAAAQTHRGRAAIRKWAVSAFVDIENFKIEVVSSFVKDGRGVVEWRWSGTDKGLMKTGKNFSVRGVSVVEVRRGKITGYKEYYDFATVMRQLGVLPEEANQ